MVSDKFLRTPKLLYTMSWVSTEMHSHPGQLNLAIPPWTQRVLVTVKERSQVK